MEKPNKRCTRQPLNYQSLGVSCWVTSMMNALLVLKKKKEKIPVLANRLLLTVLSEKGVEDKQAEVIANAIGELCNLVVEIIGDDEINIKKRVIDIKDDEVIIADTVSGKHSILILGRNNDKSLNVFDPDWDNVKDGKKTESYTCLPNVPKDSGRVNAIVNPAAFFDKKANKYNRFAFGSKKEWLIIVLKNNL